MSLAAITQIVDGDVVADASDDILKDASTCSWKSTSLVTTVGTRIDVARLDNLNSRS
jgi:hypothetical protein